MAFNPTKEQQAQIAQMKAAGLSDVKVAESFGVSRSTLHSWKKNNPHKAERIEQIEQEVYDNILEEHLATAEKTLLNMIEGRYVDEYDITQLPITNKETGDILKDPVTGEDMFETTKRIVHRKWVPASADLLKTVLFNLHDEYEPTSKIGTGGGENDVLPDGIELEFEE